MINVYSIRDIKAEAYMSPFFARTHGEAIRMVETAVNDPKSNFHQHAADYTLIYIGIFDDQSGYLEAVEHIHINDLSALLREPSLPFPSLNNPTQGK